MDIIYTLEELSKYSMPVVLTIGNFDGMHLGHLTVLEHLVQTAKKKHAKTAVLAFINHPSTILKPLQPTPLLCSLEHKITLLKKASIDLLILLPFTKKFSEQSAGEFLQAIRQQLPFKTLILGSDAHLGKNREGDRAAISSLAKTLDFQVEYLPDYTLEGQRISSSLIRTSIKEGDLKKAESLLGRPYSIHGIVLKGRGQGGPLGFPTANFNVEGLCLPPLGVYAVSLIEGKKVFQGVANLGFAPTVRTENYPMLEVHLFDAEVSLYGKEADVHFLEFIRPEKQFKTIEELRDQIALDVKSAKQIHRAIRTCS